MYLLINLENKDEKYVVELGELTNFFENKGKSWEIHIVVRWIVQEKREPLTKREKAEQPKEPIPLSRFEDSNDLS